MHRKATYYNKRRSSGSREINMQNKAVEDNAYPPSRRVLGRFAPGTRRASG